MIFSNYNVLFANITVITMTDTKKYTSKLSSAHVLIIGGSSSIGFSVAEACREHEAIVTISSSSGSKLQNAISALQSSYPSAKSRIFGHVLNGWSSMRTLVYYLVLQAIYIPKVGGVTLTTIRDDTRRYEAVTQSPLNRRHHLVGDRYRIGTE